MQSEIHIKGFDGVIKHFAQIPQAARDEIINFQQRVASEQTHEIQASFDETITSRTGRTRASIQPFVRIGTSMGTRRNPMLNTVDWLDQGTGLYGPRGQIIHIEAKKARALHFFWHGTEWFRKSVNVKGIHPRKFIGSGIAKFQARLPNRIKELERRLIEMARRTGWG